jgi:predicted GNAT family N-acyltransferase
VANVTFQIIAYGSPAYQVELALRSQVLREPLGLGLTDQELILDRDDTHLGAYLDDSKLAGCLVLKKVSDTVMKMRQVAVDPSLQGKGIGRALVKEAEKICSARGIEEIQLNAREAVVPFYQALGYETFGSIFYEVTIPHMKMTKRLGLGITPT